MHKEHTRWIAAIFALMAIAQSGAAQILPEREQEYQKRIQDLESRLTIVEGQLAALLRERTPAAPSTATATLEPRPITPATPAPGPKRFEMPPELVPEVGKIGSEVGALASAAASPFHLDSGQFYGGFIDLPLVDRPAWIHGKISYEILVGLSRSQSHVSSTSNVAQVANLAVLTTLNPNGGLQNVGQALTGTGSSPFPVTTTNRLDFRMLQVIPFSLKYTTTALDHWRLRPYGIAGLGLYVTIHDEKPISSSAGIRPDADLSPAILQAVQQAFGSKSPFGAPLVAGQIGQSPELVARGLPGGNGNINIGLQAGGGFEFRLTRSLSLGFDARYNKISGANANFATYGSRIGIHF